MKAPLKNSLSLFIGVCLLCSCTLKQKDTSELVNSQSASVAAASKSFLDIEGLGPNGDTIKFANIKAKYILVEFWASWCPPCRQFNPSLVSLYNTYQPKGFEVLSISLDHKVDKWQNAIATDGLKWPYHISDLGGWDSHWAVKFGVESIPSSFLVDSSGKVIASNMSHEQLELTLTNLFK